MKTLTNKLNFTKCIVWICVLPMTIFASPHAMAQGDLSYVTMNSGSSYEKPHDTDGNTTGDTTDMMLIPDPYSPLSPNDGKGDGKTAGEDEENEVKDDGDPAVQRDSEETSNTESFVGPNSEGTVTTVTTTTLEENGRFVREKVIKGYTLKITGGDFTGLSPYGPGGYTLTTTTDKLYELINGVKVLVAYSTEISVNWHRPDGSSTAGNYLEAKLKDGTKIKEVSVSRLRPNGNTAFEPTAIVSATLTEPPHPKATTIKGQLANGNEVPARGTNIGLRQSINAELLSWLSTTSFEVGHLANFIKSSFPEHLR